MGSGAVYENKLGLNYNKGILLDYKLGGVQTDGMMIRHCSGSNWKVVGNSTERLIFAS